MEILDTYHQGSALRQRNKQLRQRVEPSRPGDLRDLPVLGRNVRCGLAPCPSRQRGCDLPEDPLQRLLFVRRKRLDILGQNPAERLMLYIRL